jgi:hypothetical protein
MCYYRVRARNARSRATPDRDNTSPFLTRCNSTTMAPINNALAAVEALEPGEKLVYQKIAD